MGESRIRKLAGMKPKGLEYREEQVESRKHCVLRVHQGERYMEGFRWQRRLKKMKEFAERMRGDEIEKE